MKRYLRALAATFFTAASVFINPAAYAAPTGSIFFNSFDDGSIRLILNGGAPIQAANTGWYTDTGASNEPSFSNYITGLCSNCGIELFRNLFVFDIPAGLAVVSAQLSLNTFIYDSSNPTETFTLFDVTTNLGSLLAGTGGIGAYNDLGSGTAYGSRVYTSADANAVRTIDLDAAAIAAIRAAAGQSFALGGVLDSGNNRVPEPASLALLGLGLAGLAFSRRKQA